MGSNCLQGRYMFSRSSLAYYHANDATGHICLRALACFARWKYATTSTLWILSESPGVKVLCATKGSHNTGTRQSHAQVTPFAFPACERNIKKSCLSHAFWSSPIVNASVKIALSKSEPFTFASFFLPCPCDSIFLICPLSSPNRFIICMGFSVRIL